MKPLFRCSQLGDLMTNARSKSEILGLTAKTAVERQWLQDRYGYREVVTTKQMLKGLRMEGESCALIKEVLGGEFRKKYDDSKALTNEFICGHPDLVLQKESVVEDIKNSWSLRTFFEAKVTKSYEYQGLGYLDLTGKDVFRLIYTLNPTDEADIHQECINHAYKLGNDTSDDYKLIETQLHHNNDLIKLLKPEERVKVYTIERDDDKIRAIHERVEAARDYYNTLKL